MPAAGAASDPVTWPATLTPDVWTVWVQAEGEDLPTQAAWAQRRHVGERLFDIAVSEREPGTIVTLYAPSLEDGAVGLQVAAYGP